VYTYILLHVAARISECLSLQFAQKTNRYIALRAIAGFPSGTVWFRTGWPSNNGAIDVWKFAAIFLAAFCGRPLKGGQVCCQILPGLLKISDLLVGDLPVCAVSAANHIFYPPDKSESVPIFQIDRIKLRRIPNGSS
jgi:hypothetical protein